MNKNSSSHSQNRAKNQSHKRRTDEENENTFSREKFKFFIYRVPIKIFGTGNQRFKIKG